MASRSSGAAPGGAISGRASGPGSAGAASAGARAATRRAVGRADVVGAGAGAGAGAGDRLGYPGNRRRLARRRGGRARGLRRRWFGVGDRHRRARVVRAGGGARRQIEDEARGQRGERETHEGGAVATRRRRVPFGGNPRVEAGAQGGEALGPGARLPEHGDRGVGRGELGQPCGERGLGGEPRAQPRAGLRVERVVEERRQERFVLRAESRVVPRTALSHRALRRRGAPRSGRRRRASP